MGQAAWVGSGSWAGPGPAEGDFQAEFLEFADVAGDLAAGLGAALAVVRVATRYV
jgi:hypothetical protein